MAEDNIQQFATNWVVTGLLLFSLMTFAVTFIYNNNPGGLGSNADGMFNQTSSALNTKLYQTPDDADNVLNITANTNPEASDLGSRDSVASSYSITGSAKGFFDSMKTLISWIIVGEAGKMLLAVIGGLFGFTSVYFIVKWIRNGI